MVWTINFIEVLSGSWDKVFSVYCSKNEIHLFLLQILLLKSLYFGIQPLFLTGEEKHTSNDNYSFL